MSKPLSISLAQYDFMVGDIDGNTEKIVQIAKQEAQKGADLVVFSELSVVGYPPEDLLLRPSLKPRIDQALEKILEASKEVALIVGFPFYEGGKLYNCSAFFANGQCLGKYFKQALPNYQVFDEKRYFKEGNSPLVINFKGHNIGLLICEDIWLDEPAQAYSELDVEHLICINASPYCQHRHSQRIAQVQKHTKKLGLNIFYVNQVGAQDELVFDGGSFVINKKGELCAQLPFFTPDCEQIQITSERLLPKSKFAPEPSHMESIYLSLIAGLKGYVNKNGFKQVLVGLSGGIDSALTLAIAVDALGAENVRAIMMPFTYTSAMSKEDAEAQANCLGVQYESIPIEPMYQSFMQSLDDEFRHTKTDITEENLQARIRGVLLMAVSNKTGAMVIPTGNKSEFAVGYSTLYGDMVGGFALLKDVYKTQVYELANYRNQQSQAIPQRVIDRAPSAELAEDQKDEDSLPAYDVLDEILTRYIEQDLSAQEIIGQGFNQEEVYKVLRLVDISEYKRQQAAIGVRISERGFGKDRRYPITNGWKIGI